MRLGLCVVVLVLSWMHLAAGSRGTKGKRQRRISVEGSQACAKGCELCSEVNGCLKCSPKLFILLERNDIRQVGVCLPSCPPGYFDARNPDMNKCIKCKIEHCEACFSHNFCTKCKESLYLHKGRCYPACPEGSAAANGTMECSSPAQCEMSEWSPWGPCSKKKKLCGFRRGSEERTRRVLHVPAGDHAICSDTRETRRCTVQRTPCPEGQKRRKGGQGRREKVNRNPDRKESKEAGTGSWRRQGLQQPQQQGTAGPVTSAGPT
ncbi:R-spondin-1 [Dasypus novemcinctus]|uniref:R-spondin-1 n=1 Tax=Dasypus novemcinctus TaxID=9361 RepID=UPI0026603062|nr:R-spondin-1 [Dasypus novemcinctus]XP_058159841.1 R-spondin-1 [Dasypus novemcinctus]